MGWTLDREFFRLLVGLYLIVLIATVGVQSYEVLAPTWDDFSTEFDLLAEQHFGAPSDSVDMFAGGLLAISLAWHLVSLVGLSRFKPWARWSFWVSMVLATLAILIPTFAPVSFSGSLGSVVAEIGTALFGSILLLAYSHDHGCLWFKGPLETLKEIF